MGGRGRLGRAICSQGWGRFLKLNLGRRKLDAFVRSVLPVGRGAVRERKEDEEERTNLWKESVRCLLASRETETFMLMRCCCCC